jgi:hypothetical protein
MRRMTPIRIDYTPAFSCLAFAKKPHVDMFSSTIPDARSHLAKCLQKLTATHPGQVGVAFRRVLTISLESNVPFVSLLVRQSDENGLVY